MSNFRSLEIGFCDPTHNGYLEFGDPPIKGYWNLVIPPTDLLVPPAVVNAHSLMGIYFHPLIHLRNNSTIIY